MTQPVMKATPVFLLLLLLCAASWSFSSGASVHDGQGPATRRLLFRRAAEPSRRGLAFVKDAVDTIGGGGKAVADAVKAAKDAADAAAREAAAAKAAAAKAAADAQASLF
jgi:hypothetical protein